MAEFNPRVPQANDPQYLGYSRPISQPEPDKTLGTLFSGIGSAIDSGIKGLNTLVEESIKREAYAGIDPVTGKTINTLLDKSNPPAGSRALGYAAGGEAGGVAALPYDVAEAGTTAGELADARERGPLRKTYYEGTVHEFAKGLRARYPGYREEVDKAVDRAVMGGRANEFMDRLISDINSNQTDVRRNEQRLVAEVLKVDAYPKQAWLIGQIEARKITTMSEVVKHTSPYTLEKATYERRKAEREDRTGSRQFDKETELATMDADRPVAVSNRINSAITMMGLTPAKMMDFLTRSDKGLASPMEEEMIRKFGAAIQADMEEMKRQWHKEDSEGGRRSRIAIVGQKDWNERTDAHAKPMEDMVKQIFNKEYGAAYRTANMITATQNAATARIYKDKDAGFMMSNAEAFRRMFGEHGPMSNAMQRRILEKVGEGLKPYVEDNLNQISVQKNVDANGIPLTFREVIEKQQQAGVKLPESYDAYVRYMEKVTATNVTALEKRNILLAAFSPGNQGMVNKWPASVTTGDGQTKSPQMAVFQSFTSKNIATEVQKVQAAYPESNITEHYKNWTKNEVQKLFSTELNNLKDFNAERGFKYQWDDVNKRLSIVNLTGPQKANPTVQNFLNHTMNRINNTLIPSLRNMAEATGGNVDAEILGPIMNHGRTDMGMIAGVGREITEAVIQKKRQDMQEKAERKERKGRYGVE